MLHGLLHSAYLPKKSFHWHTLNLKFKEYQKTSYEKKSNFVFLLKQAMLPAYIL